MEKTEWYNQKHKKDMFKSFRCIKEYLEKSSELKLLAVE